MDHESVDNNDIDCWSLYEQFPALSRLIAPINTVSRVATDRKHVVLIHSALHIDVGPLLETIGHYSTLLYLRLMRES